MAGSVEERLRLVVDATTGSAEASFDKLTGAARKTASASDAAAESVAASADVVAAARAKEADAAGKVSVAEVRLDELRNGGKASASQLAAAEERVAAAQRQLQIATAATTKATEAQTVVQAEAATGAVVTGAATEKYREQVSDLRNSMVGFIAGVSLADWLHESVTGFLEGSRGAAALAQSMNSTVEEAGQLNTLLGTLGLEMDDVLEIQASFAQVLAGQPELLASFGAAIQTNADGTTNWTTTLESALENLQQIPDATKRNQLGFQLFGEEGYKQLSRLLLSGRSVKDALAAIGTPFDADDVAATRRFDAAMLDLKQTGGGVSRELGGVLVPALTGVLGVVGQLVTIVTAVPTPLLLATAAAITFGFAQRSAAAEGGMLAGVLSGLQGRALTFRTAAAEAAVGSTLLGRGLGAARVAGGGLMGVLGGPLGVAILGLTAGFTILNKVTGSNSDQSQKAEQAQTDLAAALKASNGVVTDAVRQQAALSAQESGLLSVAEKAGVAHGTVTEAILGNKDAYREVTTALDRYIKAHSNAGGGDVSFGNHLDDEGDAADDARGALDDLTDSTKGTATSQAALATELGETVDVAAVAQAAMDALTGAIDAGQTSTGTFAELVRQAAQAQDAQTASSDLAKAAIEAYHATTDGAVQATLDFFSAQLSLSDQQIAVQKAFEELRTTVDDSKTPWNEVAEAQNRAIETALSYAKSAADAAVAGAEAQGQIVDAAGEAQIRAQATLDALRSSLNQPGLTDAATAQIQGMIDTLETAQGKGDIDAVLTLTGVPEAKAEVEDATAPKTTTVTVETRGGPAVLDYLKTITDAPRLALVRVESRNGPAVNEYLNGLAAERLAIIRVETRGGPSVQRYLDGLAADRTAVINVQRTGGTGGGPVGGPALRGAPAVSGPLGGSLVVQQLSVTVAGDGSGRVSAASLVDAGRSVAAQLDAHARANGFSWRNPRTP